MPQVKALLVSITIVTLLLSLASAQNQSIPLQLPTVNISKEKTLFTLGYAHLDTEWRWDYQMTISKYIKNTLLDNFRLFEKYPNYVFNFSGANRYRMMKEYYPAEYERMKQYVADNRWFPAGSSMEENDALIPSSESILRQVLYGNNYFHKELGKASYEYMLPDCFGFPASLPSILAHVGLKGFSTQKLTWGSAIGIPFNVGSWIGPDGNGVIVSFNPGDYVSKIREDLSKSSAWLKRIDDNFSRSGISAEYIYYGTGDIGGSPTEESVQWIEKSLTSKGPIRVLSAPADLFFTSISTEQKAALPKYRGELLLTNHSAGSLTSQAFLKRWNRKNELLASSAEAASLMAEWLGGIAYPREKLNEAWRLVLGAQFHDIMAGTCIPRGNEFAWNDETIALNQFANALSDAVGAVSRSLDTEAKGIPIVVYNPLSIRREDVTEATVDFSSSAPKAIQVFNGDGNAVPSQVLRREGSRLTILFLATVPSVGFAVYDVRPAEKETEQSKLLQISKQIVENEHYKVTINSAGDIASVYDKAAARELLAEPARLAFLYERPEDYPAWNMDWADRKNPPVGYVDGHPRVRIVESGPVRVALEVDRESRGSRFVQHIQLTLKGERVEFDTYIDWYTKESSLKASFPFTVSNPLATYNTGVGTIQRGNNNPKKFEVPSQQWFDLTAKDGSYGVSILEDSKYGSDKPSDNTLRLTLLYTPGVRGGYMDQATQDFGKHRMLYALYGHQGDWRTANSQWHAARLNQPLVAFQTLRHPGALGKSFSFLSLSSDDVAVMACKKAENSDALILRLVELKGKESKNVQLKFAGTIVAAEEVNGQEQHLASLQPVDGKLTIDMTSYQLRTFALTLEKPATSLSLPKSQSVALPFNVDVISSEKKKQDGAFDKSGASLPAEMLPALITSEGVSFTFGSTKDGEKNAVACKGQSITLPSGMVNRLYLLAASTEDHTRGEFKIDGKSFPVMVQSWSGYFGQADNRTWDNYEWRESNYTWENIIYTGLIPGYVKQDNIAYFTTHRHLANGENEPYIYTYLFKYALDIPTGAKVLTLPDDERIRLFALTAAYNENDNTHPAQSLYDTLNVEAGEYERYMVCSQPRILPEYRIMEEGQKVEITMSANEKDASIYYTTNGSIPTTASSIFKRPFIIDRTTIIKAMTVKEGKAPSAVKEESYYRAYKVEKAEYLTQYSPRYAAAGDMALIDSKRGPTSYSNKAWQGFEGNDLEVILDLGIVKPIHKVSVSCLSTNGSWIFRPVAVEIAAAGENKNFSIIGSEHYDSPSSNEGVFIKLLAPSLKQTQVRYLRVKAKNMGLCPPWHPGTGEKAWIFVDEIIVE
ncbi:MAG: glycoside hydrolase family 38 C-terminal domain-containing protein [bacterium]